MSTLLLGNVVNGYFARSVTTPIDSNYTMITIHDQDPDAISMSGAPWDPVISADFSGFFVDFNGNKMLKGGRDRKGGQGLFSFELSWSAYFAEGPFPGLTGNWTLTGTAVTAVPEAETYALMLAGVGLVGFAARRRI